MVYRVQLFALLKERTGLAAWEYRSKEPMTGLDLLAAFFDSFPGLEGLRHVTRLAVNRAFCNGNLQLRESDELAFIPPVSGG